MTQVTRTLQHPIDEVFAVLVDPWTYPDWLVGAKEMRSVDATWPVPGASFHHRVGLGGPLSIADSSTCLEVVTPNRLVLEVRARPAGRGKVTFRLTSPTPATTEVAFAEEPLGAARLLTPVAAPLAVLRNHRSLQHLERYLAEGAAQT